ncbi:MAG: UDP-3-O-(3-hydroxymyristoyl)glucosamine N-acyltransferase [Kangiellaceae bacterium]
MAEKLLTVSEIAKIVDGELEGDGNKGITSVAPLDRALDHQISFLSNPKFKQQLDTTQSGCVLLSAQSKKSYKFPVIYCKDPYLAFALISQALDVSPRLADSISAQASVDPTAQIADGVTLAAGVYVGKNCKIESNVSIGANTTLADNTFVAEGTKIYPNVSIYHNVAIGKNCIIHSGTVVGSDGFGYANNSGDWVKIVQSGGVRIGDNVEIGANTTIDRGALDDTVIANGVKIDNLCHIAHNVELGENTAMAAFTGVAGSTVIGKGCTFSGRSSIIGHLNIAAGTHLTAGTMVNKSNTKPGIYSSGTGAQENRLWRKNVARFKQLDEMAKKIRSLEQQLKDLTKG